MGVETKIASCFFFVLEKGLFRQIKGYSEVAIQFATFCGFSFIKSIFRPSQFSKKPLI